MPRAACGPEAVRDGTVWGTDALTPVTLAVPRGALHAGALGRDGGRISCIALITVAVRIAPVAPERWPSAIAPPSRFTFAGRARAGITASDWRRRLVELDPVEAATARARPP